MRLKQEKTTKKGGWQYKNHQDHEVNTAKDAFSKKHIPLSKASLFGCPIFSWSV
jgi:hypothetical protein